MIGIVSVLGNLQDQSNIPCGSTVTLTFEVTDGCNTVQETLDITVDKGVLHYCTNMIKKSRALTTCLSAKNLLHL